MAIRSTFIGFSASRKNSLLLGTIIFLISAAGILTSVGQTILHSRKISTPKSVRTSLVLDNPVFSPLMPSHIGMVQVPAGTHVVYDGYVQPDLNYNGEWWSPGVEAGMLESEPPKSRPSSAIAIGGLRSFYPVRPPINFNRHTGAVDFVNLGVADLLQTLREKDLKRQSNKGDIAANPFEEALKETSEKQAPEKTTKVDIEVQRTKEATDRNPDSSASVLAQRRNFVLIGSFAGQSIAAVTASSDQSFVRNQSNAEAFGFDLADTKQYFDLNVMLRNRDNQESVAFGDLNGDGFLDVVVTNKSINQALVYMNDGRGNYSLCTGIYGGNGPAMGTIGDFNEDGLPDVAIMLQTDKRIVADGKGLRKFIFLPTSDIVSDGYSSMIPYDFSGSGIQDLLLTDFRNSTATVYRNVGQAIFAVADSYSLQSIPLLQSRSDLNNDGIDDLLFVQYLGNHVSIVFQNGADGAVSNLANSILNPSIYYAVGDFDQNGVIDVALAHRRQ